MALPTSYLTSTKNLEGILNAVRNAKAPDRFTQGFLESLEYKSSTDRLVIGVFKSLGFLNDNGEPQERYFRFLDQTESAKVLAEGIRDAYADLFAVNVHAEKMSRADVKNKLKTLSQGQLTESVLDKMASTFTALTALADFDATEGPAVQPPVDDAVKSQDMSEERESNSGTSGISFGGLVYNIQIVLPDSRDPAVYDALFKSLRQHLVP